MKNIINIAKVSYTVNSKTKTVESNISVVKYDNNFDIISGEVSCGLYRKKWKLYLIEDASQWIAHCISGNSTQKFSFNVDADKQYKLKFVCQKGCCLHIDSSSQNKISQICFKQI